MTARLIALGLAAKRNEDRVGTASVATAFGLFAYMAIRCAPAIINGAFAWARAHGWL